MNELFSVGDAVWAVQVVEGTHSLAVRKSWFPIPVLP